ncbi:MAG: NAD(P)-dependent glycerol-3-phosphate dehydrogenase [Planctomycetota bacterium]|nr:NAD(P)-dependent glycerol-3-phosphate dehydrogenase [Planctomycetota bacterium]
MALVLAERGWRALIWGHDPGYLQEMERQRENRLFLPGVQLPESVAFEPSLKTAIAAAEMIFVAVPTKFLRSVLAQAPAAARGKAVVSLSKGIEPETLRRPSEIIAEILAPARVAALSGPSHAEEVARRLPASVVVASADNGALARKVQEAAMTARFRIYTSDDILGVEMGGALKNVIALAAGICLGLEMGDNALAALITRGLAEITRLAVAMGANPRTLAGLSGMGDLIVTCTSAHSRNRRVGIALGQGRRLKDILAETPQVAEGVTTARSAVALGQRYGVEMPICEQVYRVLYEDKPAAQAAAELLAREGKAE